MDDHDRARVDDLATVVADNRARLQSLETEHSRSRQRIHDLEADRTALRMLTQQVTDLTGQMADVAGELRNLSRRAVERPTTAGLTTTAAWCSVMIAVVALLTTLLR